MADSEMMVPLLPEEAAKEYIDIAIMFDGAGNMFLSLGEPDLANANETWVKTHKIRTDGSQPTGPWFRYPPPGFKIDDIDMDRSGNDVAVVAGVHEAISGVRLIIPVIGWISGEYETRPGMEAERGGAGAWRGGEPSGGGGGNVTHEQIVAAVREVIGLSSATLVQAISGRTEEQGGNIRQGIEDKVKDSLREEGVITLGNIYLSDGLYQRFVDTTSEEVVKALTSYGVAREPTP